MSMLIAMRFIQRVGAGALMPIATTIVGDIYNREERAKIQGYLSSVWGISAVSGPLLGGFFVDVLDWRFVFWMNIPLGLIDRKSTRLNSSHVAISYAVFCLKKKNIEILGSCVQSF